MTDKPSMKEVKSYIRQRAAEARGWELLEEQIGEAADLSAFIAQQKRESGELEKENAKARDLVAEALATAQQTKSAAEARAKEILSNAESIRTDAEQRALSVDAIVADAHSEADRLREVGRQDGERLANELDGRITNLRIEVSELDTKRTTLANDIAALEKRKTVVQGQITKLRESLAETA